VTRSGGESNNYYPVRISGCDLTDEFRHRFARKKFGRMLISRTAGQHGHLLYIRAQQHITQIQVFMQQHVKQALAGGKPKYLSTVGLATSASTSKTVLSISMAMLIARLIAVNVLPSPGQAAGHHDQIATLNKRTGLSLSVLKERTFDHAKFVSDA
jgi:hypothetical protein